MNVLSWNLCQRRALPMLAPIVAQYRPQLVLLQEADCPVDWPGARVGHMVSGRPWGSWILAAEGVLEPISIPEYAGWLTGARWTHGADSTAIFSLHSPTGTSQSYVAESLRMIRLIDQAAGRTIPLVIGGDFNFRSLGHRDDAEAIRNTQEELQALKAFHELGLAVAWRAVHPSGSLPQTLRWSRSPATPYHCDGYLVRNISVDACQVLTTESIGFPSDHDPVLVMLATTAAD